MERGQAGHPDQPEIATSEEWRTQMRTAREASGMTQAELGRLVGTSQNMISNLESGKVGSSQFVLPICRVLRINPPTWFESDDERRWVDLGRELRRRDVEVFLQALRMVESMVAALGRPPTR